jgi:beta-mannanase
MDARGDCGSSNELFNRFGFTPETAASPDGDKGAALLPLDNYVLSWDRKAEWSKNVSQETELRKDFAFADENSRIPMLTLEPWPTAGRSSRTLLQDIVAAKYDDNISWVCKAIHDYGKQVFVRWGHEMENVTGRYPWAITNPTAYINAYRYFVTQCRSIASNITYLWSPAGNRNLQDYWPGVEYVDYIGLTVLNYEAWEVIYYGYNRTFEENFRERFDYVESYNLPIIIAECNATGAGRNEWIASALNGITKFPDVKSVVLFTAIDPVSWGPVPPPDWRLDPGTPAQNSDKTSK